MLITILGSPCYYFTVQMVLAALGTALSYRYGGISHDYWLLMLAVLAGLSISRQALDLKLDKTQVIRLLREPLLRWLGGFIAAVFVFSLHQTGRMPHEETGMVILFIMTLMVYLDSLKQSG